MKMPRVTFNSKQLIIRKNIDVKKMKIFIIGGGGGNQHFRHFRHRVLAIFQSFGVNVEKIKR